MLDSVRKMPLWAYLLLMGFGTFYTHDLVIAYDMGQYMNYALNIFSGKGYSGPHGTFIFRRAPLFSMIIAMHYWLLGVSPWSAFWVVRIFCILNPMLIYFLGKKLFGKWVGFSAGLLILSSYSMNYWSYRHIDAVWPFFVFLSMYFIYEGLEKDNKVYIAIAGVSIGISFLIKEVTVLLFAFPVILIIFCGRFRRKESFKSLLIFYSMLTLAVSPWLIYLMSHDAVSFIVGKSGPKVIEIMSPNRLPGSESTAGILNSGLRYFSGFVDFYNGQVISNSMAQNFMAAPLLVISWGFVVIKAVKGNTGSRLLVSSMFCFLPVICLMGIYNFRCGQVLYFYYLSYLSLGYLMWHISKLLFMIKSNIFRRDSLISQFMLFIILTTVISAGQFFLSKNGDYGGKKFFERSYFYQIARGNGFKNNIGGLYGRDGQEAGEWVRNNIPGGSKIIADKIDPIYFYSGGEYTCFPVPIVFKIFYMDEFNMDKAVKNGNGSEKLDRRNAIFISSPKGGDDPQNYIAVLPENVLLSFIEKNRVEYIVIQRTRNYLSIYFDKNESFLKVKEFGNGCIKIYRVIDVKPLQNFEPLITIRAANYLKILKNDKSDKFEWYVRNLFQPVLGWNYNDVEKLTHLTKKNKLDGFTVVKKGRVYQSTR